MRGADSAYEHGQHFPGNPSMVWDTIANTWVHESRLTDLNPGAVPAWVWVAGLVAAFVLLGKR